MQVPGPEQVVAGSEPGRGNADERIQTAGLPVEPPFLKAQGAQAGSAPTWNSPRGDGWAGLITRAKRL